jgi:class 3 adenylate cyclase
VQPETRYAKSGDVSIAYQVVGDGPFDVVFAPGIVSHIDLLWEMRTFQTRIAERLASFSRLILFDKRGTGMSDSFTSVPPLETRMDDVRAVMDAAGSSRAALVGLDDVAAMALVFAATYPERTTALVLLSASARGMWAPDFPWGLTHEQVRAMKADALRGWFGSREDALPMVRATLGDFEDDEIWRMRDYARRASSPGAYQEQVSMTTETDVRQVLPAIRVPTLVFHGTDNPILPIAGARYLAERVAGAKLVELEGQRHLPVGAALDRTMDEIEGFLTEIWKTGGWDEPEPDRVLATVLFTDIAGSTERAAKLGDRAWHDLLGRHHELVRRQLVRFRGEEVNTAGDGFVASFDGPARAIRCACAVVESVRELEIEVRAGLHTGECELVNGKVSGIAVHTGARVAAEAGPSEVLVSSTVKDLVAGSGLAFQDRGLHELKGIPGEWRLYAVKQRRGQAAEEALKLYDAKGNV